MEDEGFPAAWADAVPLRAHARAHDLADRAGLTDEEWKQKEAEGLIAAMIERWPEDILSAAQEAYQLSRSTDFKTWIELVDPAGMLWEAFSADDGYPQHFAGPGPFAAVLAAARAQDRDCQVLRP